MLFIAYAQRVGKVISYKLYPLYPNGSPFNLLLSRLGCSLKHEIRALTHADSVIS